jgi:CTP:molybdopterin cytidylyltransferase MocA
VPDHQDSAARMFVKHTARQAARIVRRSDDRCEAEARGHRRRRHLTANRRRYVNGVDVPWRMNIAKHAGQQLGPGEACGTERRVAAALFFFRVPHHYNGGRIRRGPDPDFETQEAHYDQRAEHRQPDWHQKRTVLQLRVISRHAAMIPMKRGMSPRSLTLRIVVLCAGFSVRLGQPKALARIHGLSLLDRTIRAVSPFRASTGIIVVIPHRAVSYTLGFPRRSVEFVANAVRATGLASSVRLGVRRARHSAGILLLPVDLVDLERRDIARLIARWRGARRRVAARRVESHAGSPLILPRWLYARALTISGDAGLRELVRRLPRQAVSLTDLPSANLDLDTPQDLERARRRTRPLR